MVSMASPQLENGFTRIANEIVDKLASLYLSPNEWRCLMCVFRKTYGYRKLTDNISFSQFSNFTGLKRPHVARAIKGLLSKQVIGITRNGTTGVNNYCFSKDYTKWKVVPKQVIPLKGVTSNAKKVLPKQVHTKEIIQKKYIYIPYKEIIEYLNAKANTKYKPTTPKTILLIRSRFSEGFTLDDFKAVIDIKVENWLNDAKMSRYLRPETLFGTKFESYLNEIKTESDDIGEMRVR